MMGCKLWRWAAVASLVLAALMARPGESAAQQGTAIKPPVDLLLVLAVDASGSITTGEFSLQREGIAAAVINERVLRAIRSGPLGSIAIAYVEWGGPGMTRTMVDWQRVSDEMTARAFANSVLSAPRSPQSYNAIGDALLHSVDEIERAPFEGARMVIDLSGDNRDMRSAIAAPLARDMAVAKGITINGLPIIEDAGEGLVDYFKRDVIGGNGAFVKPAASRADFAQALLEKMVLEIAGDIPADTRLLAQGR